MCRFAAEFSPNGETHFCTIDTPAPSETIINGHLPIRVTQNGLAQGWRTLQETQNAVGPMQACLLPSGRNSLANSIFSTSGRDTTVGIVNSSSNIGDLLITLLQVMFFSIRVRCLQKEVWN